MNFTPGYYSSFQEVAVVFEHQISRHMMQAPHSPLAGRLDKKGLGWLYRPWASRDFTFDENTRILTYRRDGIYRGSVKVDDDKPIVTVTPANADGRNNAFEVPCFVVNERGTVNLYGKK